MDEFVQFTRDFYTFTGIDLSLYKRPQMERRLTSLRNKHGYSDFASFLAAIKRSDVLLHEFLDRMTINVSEFFRNPERWDILTSYISQMARPQNQFQAWSAACSTGEEPYTLSIILQEKIKWPYRILATDIDKNVLAQAQEGLYKEHQIKGVAEPYLQKYFTTQPGIWKVDAGLRDHIQFKLHNLLSDDYPQSLDLIICRNVLIYFTEEAKHLIVSKFAKSLKPGGLLFVGSTEQFLHTEQYGLVNVSPFLYKRGL